MVEPAAHNGLVGGSNPSGPTGASLRIAAAAPTVRRMSWGPVAATAVGVVIAIVAVSALRHILHAVTLGDVVAAIAAMPVARLVAGAALVGLSYVMLVGYDALALGHLGYRLSARTTALAAFTSFTMSHMLGLAALTGGTVRFRQYTRAGVRPHDVVLIVAMCGVTFWLAIVVVAGIGLMLDPQLMPSTLTLPPALERWAGAILLMGAGAYALASSLFRRELRLFGLDLRLPGWRLTAAQLGVGLLDLVAAAGALYVLLPTAGAPPFLTCAAIYAVAMIVGALSHSPGGLGVFEAIVVVMLPRIDHGQLLAALVLFRLIYSFVPFAIGLFLLGRDELGALRSRRACAAGAAP